ncbi:MAG: hypothetical protein V4629_03205 [Pseudomonadota bacterium]
MNSVEYFKNESLVDDFENQLITLHGKDNVGKIHDSVKDEIFFTVCIGRGMFGCHPVVEDGELFFSVDTIVRGSFKRSENGI